MRDALRGYLSMASGLTEVTLERAAAAARALLAQGEATAEQVTQLTDELLTTSRSNREALSNLIRYEVDRRLDQMGLVTADKLRALTARVATLEALARSGAAVDPAAAASPERTRQAEQTAGTPQAKKAPAKKAPAKKATAKKATAKKATAKKATAKKSHRVTSPGAGGTS